MPKPFFNVPEDNKFFPRLKMLPNIPAPCWVLRFLCRLGPIFEIFLLWHLTVNFFCLPFHISLKKTVRQVMLHVVVSLFVLTIFCFYIYLLRLRLLPPNIFFITTPLNEPNMGAANAPIGKNLPLCLRLFCLPPIYQTTRLTDCFFILKSCRLLVQCYMFFDVKLAPVAITRTNTHQVNMRVFLTLIFW